MKVPQRSLNLFLVLLTGLLFAGGAQAALESRNNGMVYDTDLNLTWLADAGAAGTPLDWTTADAWTTELNHAGITGWRLPTAAPPDYYSTTSEMGHLFYVELGGQQDTPISQVHNAFYALFSNVVDGGYWSNTPDDADPAFAWNFDFYDGTQLAYDGTVQFGAWAVHEGDVGAVPEPSTVLLLGLGAAGLIGLRRRASHMK